MFKFEGAPGLSVLLRLCRGSCCTLRPVVTMSSLIDDKDGEDDKPAKKRKSKEKSEPKKRKGKSELTGKDAEIAELRKVRESARLADF